MTHKISPKPADDAKHREILYNPPPACRCSCDSLRPSTYRHYVPAPTIASATAQHPHEAFLQLDFMAITIQVPDTLEDTETALLIHLSQVQHNPKPYRPQREQAVRARCSEDKLDIVSTPQAFAPGGLAGLSRQLQVCVSVFACQGCATQGCITVLPCCNRVPGISFSQRLHLVLLTLRCPAALHSRFKSLKAPFLPSAFSMQLTHIGMAHAPSMITIISSRGRILWQNGRYVKYLCVFV